MSPGEHKPIAGMAMSAGPFTAIATGLAMIAGLPAILRIRRARRRAVSRLIESVPPATGATQQIS